MRTIKQDWLATVAELAQEDDPACRRRGQALADVEGLLNDAKGLAAFAFGSPQPPEVVVRVAALVAERERRLSAVSNDHDDYGNDIATR